MSSKHKNDLVSFIIGIISFVSIGVLFFYFKPETSIGKNLREIIHGSSSGERYVKGNGGYDVIKYAIQSDVDLKQKAFRKASVSITSKSLQPLSDFSLDFAYYAISSVNVDGRRAAFKQANNKLIITPTKKIEQNNFFVTTVNYSGGFKLEMIGTGSMVRRYGWIATNNNDGGVFYTAQSHAYLLFPNNEILTDKAVINLSVSAESPYVVVAPAVEQVGGALNTSTTQRIYNFSTLYPVTSSSIYLAIGTFNKQTIPLVTGTNFTMYSPQSVGEELIPTYTKESEIVSFLNSYLGKDLTTQLTSTIIDAPIGSDYPLFVNTTSTMNLTKDISRIYFGDIVTPITAEDRLFFDGINNYFQTKWMETEQGRDIFETFMLQQYANELDAAVVSPGEQNIRSLFKTLEATGLVNGRKYKQVDLQKALQYLFEKHLSPDALQQLLTTVPAEGLTLEEVAYNIQSFNFKPFISGKKTIASFGRLLEGRGKESIEKELDKIQLNTKERLPYSRNLLLIYTIENKLGKNTFANVLKTFIDRYGYASAGKEQFIQTLNDVTAKQWEPYFAAWNSQSKLPDIPELRIRFSNIN